MDSEITAWTIQGPRWLETLHRQGFVSGDGRRVDPLLRPAYGWLREQMARRVSDYNRKSPVWFWHAPKPDLRRAGHLKKGARGARVELSLPRARVLLFDFEAWHAVLNGWHLALSDAESDDWDRRASRFTRGNLPSSLQAELRASWERVFDLESLRRSELWGPIDRIQGVIDRVDASQVRRVEWFISR